MNREEATWSLGWVSRVGACLSLSYTVTLNRMSCFLSLSHADPSKVRELHVDGNRFIAFLAHPYTYLEH